MAPLSRRQSDIDRREAPSYKHKFGLGYSAPWLSLGLSGWHDDYRDAIRDSTAWKRAPSWASASAKHSTRRSVPSTTGVYARNDLPVVPGISGRVFDVRGKSAYIRAGYALTEQLQAGANFAVRRGDVVSTTRRHLEILSSRRPLPPTRPSATTFAYRLRGTSTTQTAAVTLSWAFSDHSSLNFRYA